MMIKEELVTMALPFHDRYDKTVRVFVPEHEEGETLPVVYMTDGQNLFEEERAAFGCWYTREAVRAEHQESGKAAIIVGIHNDEGALQRTNELTPRSIGEVVFPRDLPRRMKKGFSPQGELFDDFVVRTVMPAVQARFPVKTGREHTAFCGSSSGGLQSFFTVLSHPGLFSAAGVFSPAFPLYTADDLSAWARAKAGEDMPFLFLYSGAGDELEQEICESTELVYDMLMECYPMEQLYEVILPERRHHESAWELMFRDFLHAFLTRGEY